MTIVYILIAILMFGFMIFTHELGHYTFARIFHVKIFEFSLGMGPKLLSRVSKKTAIRYSWRLFPIGGFVSMAGEDEESDEPDALCRKPVWQRMIITAAGGLTNLILGILVMTVLVCFMKNLYGTTVRGFAEGASSSSCGRGYHCGCGRGACAYLPGAFLSDYASRCRACGSQREAKRRDSGAFRCCFPHSDRIRAYFRGI